MKCILKNLWHFMIQPLRFSSKKVGNSTLGKIALYPPLLPSRIPILSPRLPFLWGGMLPSMLVFYLLPPSLLWVAFKEFKAVNDVSFCTCSCSIFLLNSVPCNVTSALITCISSSVCLLCSSKDLILLLSTMVENDRMFLLGSL
jgi:hypothetical protein